jgi:hypothetical protein
MALDFPSSPTDGQVYESFYWDDTAGIWRRQLTVTEIDDLDDVAISSPTDGDFLVYDDSSGDWVNETISYSYDINDLTSLDSDNIIVAPNYDIDVTSSTNPGTFDFNFSSGTGLFTISTNGSLTFTGSNYKAGGIKTARIANSTASSQTLTFPANWKFVGIKPTLINANKIGILTLTSFTTSDTGCVAAYIEEL